MTYCVLTVTKLSLLFVSIVYAMRYIKGLLASFVKAGGWLVILLVSYFILYLFVSLALSDDWHWQSSLTGLAIAGYCSSGSCSLTLDKWINRVLGHSSQLN